MLEQEDVPGSREREGERKKWTAAFHDEITLRRIART